MNTAAREIPLKKLAAEKPLVQAGENIAVFGAGGQIGHALRPLLDEIYPKQVIYCDAGNNAKKSGFVDLDITSEANVKDFLKQHNVKVVINLAALLSIATTGKPEAALNVNLWAAVNLMKIAGECGVRKVH